MKVLSPGVISKVGSVWSCERVNVVLNRTVVVDSDWRFDNLCGSHLQSQSELYHVSWWYYTLVIDLIGQLRRDVIGRLSVKPWCYWLWRLVISNWCVSTRLLSLLLSPTFVTFLGVTLDENLNWKSEISYVANKVAKSIGIISRCSFFLPKSPLRLLYYSLIYSLGFNL